jgi:hypothetical protein
MCNPLWQVVRNALAVLVCAAVVGCQPAAQPGPSPADYDPDDGPPVAPWFEDVTEESGLNFVHDAGPLGSYFMPQAIGSGAAVFDLNNDGRLYIYLLQNGGPGSHSTNRLYQPLPGGGFKDVSAGSGLDIAGYNMGVAIGDVNNDGLPDVLVTQFNGVKLFLNNGNGTFTDITLEAGLDNPGWGASAAFLDFDRDGWLDLVVVNYVDYDPTWHCAPAGRPEYCAPRTFRGRVTRLFRNLGRAAPGKAEGKGVRFEDVTESSGLGRLPGPGLGVVCADFDGDGWPDIFIANDGEANRLWINQHDGTFRDEAVKRGVAYNAMAQAEAGMGIALGDFHGDGLFDLYATHLTEETNTLWRQGPRGFFRDRTALSHVARTRWRGTGFGAIAGDFNQDGALDLAVVNGRVRKADVSANESLGPHWGHYAERNQLLLNDGTGRFRDVSPWNRAFCGTPNVARGLAAGVFDDKRGALDLLVTTIAGRARLYRNCCPERGHWLLVRAVDPRRGGRDAYGAEVRVQAGDKQWFRLINPCSSFLCSNDPRAHFGLGAVDRVEAIEVRWPEDGTIETFAGCNADRLVVLSKGASKK